MKRRKRSAVKTLVCCQRVRVFTTSGHLLRIRKGTMHTISPGRNRVNFQILAYLLTIDLLYGTGCLSY